VKKLVDKKFWSTAFTLTGTIIGAGILGLPYVFAHSGFLVGLFWIIVLGLILLYVKLCLGEIGLRTKGNHQLAGYAEKYLGIWGKRLMFFAVIFGIYSALLAYLIGEGQSFSHLITGNLDYALYFAIGFWLIMTLFLREGLKGLKKIETLGVLVIISLIILITVLYAPGIKMENLKFINSNLFLPFGVILFALLGFTSIPELRMEIKGSEKKFKKAIIIGILIPIVIYIFFTLVFVGVLGKNIPEVSTLSFGPLVTILGIFTMLTSYFVLSFSLKDMFQFDLKSSKLMIGFWVSIFPLLLYLLVSFFGLFGFVAVLGIGGVVSGGLTGILILLIGIKAKKHGERKPEYKIPLNWLVVIILSLVFIGGIVVELLF
jgi:amino acid permease